MIFNNIKYKNIKKLKNRNNPFHTALNINKI